MSARIFSLLPDRKSRTSKIYSPTTCSISCLSSGGWVYSQVVSGVRKSVTIKPFSGRGGEGPRKPMTKEGFSFCGRGIQSRAFFFGREVGVGKGGERSEKGGGGEEGRSRGG